MEITPSRVLVTGATGFVGHHLLALLLQQGCAVAATSVPGDALLGQLPAGVQTFAFDVRDVETATRLVREVRPEIIFHLAAILQSRDLATLLSINVTGTDALLRAARALATPPTVVVPGSAAEYGVPAQRAPFSEDAPLRPISNYGVSKAAQILTALAYARRQEVPVVVGRIFNIAGPNEPDRMLCGAVASQIAHHEARGEPGVLRVGNLTPYRDYLDVRDAVRALWHLALKGNSGEVYNIAKGVAYQVQDLVDGLVALARVPITLQPDPSRQRPVDLPYCCGDVTRLRSAGWAETYTLAETLADTLASWRDLSSAG